MFVFFPIGHEEHRVKRLPVVTIAIMLSCVVIALLTIPKAERLTNELVAIEQEIKELKVMVYTQYATQKKGSWVWDLLESEPSNYMELYKELGDRIEKYWQDFINGKIGKPDDPIRFRYQTLSERKQKLESSHPFIRYGFNPTKFRLFTLFTSAFLHASWLHLIFNLLFFFIVAPNLEDVWGRPIFAGLYLASAMVSMLVHTAMFPSLDSPCVGASGAIAGLMGAFAIRFAKTRISIWYLLMLFIKPYIGVVQLPAYLFFGFWFLLQLFWGIIVKSAPSVSNVAFWAHIGGFLFGALSAAVIIALGVERKYLASRIEEKASPEVKIDSRLKKAMELSMSGDNKGAIILLESYLADNPESIPAKLERIRNYVAIGELPNDAGDVLASLIGLPEYDDEAIELYLKACEIKPQFCISSHAMFRIFRTLERNRDYLSAKKVFEMLKANFPKDSKMPATYLSMARLSQKSGDIAYAREILTEMIAKFPQDPLVELAKESLEKL